MASGLVLRVRAFWLCGPGSYLATPQRAHSPAILRALVRSLEIDASAPVGAVRRINAMSYCTNESICCGRGDRGGNARLSVRVSLRKLFQQVGGFRHRHAQLRGERAEVHGVSGHLCPPAGAPTAALAAPGKGARLRFFERCSTWLTSERSGMCDPSIAVRLYSCLRSMAKSCSASDSASMNSVALMWSVRSLAEMWLASCRN